MRCVILTLLGAAMLGALFGATVVGLGLYNVSAAAGHWPGVSWILHTTYRNSVELRAPPPSQVPELTDDMAAIGALHFDSACRFCHTSPGGERSATALSMVPEPPRITEAVEHWEPHDLHWIVQNGVKMSGMPHWPSEIREDDVWLVVAFLERVRNMTAESYAELVASPDHPDPVVAYCAGCHGLDGKGDGNSAVPRLDILGEAYIAASLSAYRAGIRHSGVMQHAASRLSDDQITLLAEHYAGEPAAPATLPAMPVDLVAMGRELALGETGSKDVPACRACHGPWPTQRSPLFPNLTGQRADYLYDQLMLWRAGKRGGTPRAQIMHVVAGEIEPGQMRALAAFYAAGAPD